MARSGRAGRGACRRALYASPAVSTSPRSVQSNGRRCGPRPSTVCSCSRARSTRASASTMTWYKVKDALAAEPGTHLTVRGWVRSHRQSKADGGLSFIAVSDGTCFNTIQVVAQRDARLRGANRGAGRGRGRRGRRRAGGRQGKGQAVELAAAAVTVVGNGRTRRATPSQKKRHSFEFLREAGPPAAADQHLRRDRPRAEHCVSLDPRVLPGARTSSTSTRRSSRPATARAPGEMFRVTTLDPANPPRPTRPGRLPQDFFGGRAYLTVSGQLEAEIFACALGKIYTFGPTFRAENSQHPAPPGRVLDDRAGDGLLRPARQHGPGRGVPEAHLRDVLEHCARGHGVLQQARSTRPCIEHARARRRAATSSASPTPRRSRSCRSPGADVRVPRRTGATTCRPSTSAT